MGLGGGTGSGGGPEVIKIAQDIIKSRGGDPLKDVIAIITLPNPRVDGPRQCFNALEAYAKIDQLKVPTITVDNTLVEKAVPSTFKDIWGPVNLWIAKTFHAFNNFANQESQQGVLDARDLNDVFSRGRITFSACGVRDIDDKYSVSERIVNNLTKSLFAATSLRSAEAAGCVVLINESVCDRLSSSDLEPAFEELNNSMRKHSTLHRGIYVRDLSSGKGAGPAMFWYVMLSGIDHPWETLETLFAKAKAFSQEYGNVRAFFED
jgi:cell division GTPase FtsZ